jgi:UDP-galactopyranose mutase
MSAARRSDRGARVVVVGGGFAGIAVAVRLAKLGHRVTLLEADDELGGSLRPVRHDGLAWDRGATTLTLPAVLRDLFRKSGRPLEAELELRPCTPGRRHVFTDSTVLDLPLGSRGVQHQALTETLGARSAQAWTGHLDSLTPVWETLRRYALEVPFTGCGTLPSDALARLQRRRRLSAVARSMRSDPRLRALLVDRYLLAGQQERGMPAFLTVLDHVERGFGRWQPAGGMAALLPVLERRLATRAVQVLLGTRAMDVAESGGRVTAVHTAAGQWLDADVVVWSGASLPAVLAATSDVLPRAATPAARTYLGLAEPVPGLPAETFLHGDPLVLIRPGASHNGRAAWSVEHQPGPEDVVTTMASRGVDVRSLVRSRLDRTPAQVLDEHGASPAGMLWQGWRSGVRRPVPRTRVHGLFLIGSQIHPGPGVVSAGLAAAQVADLVGRA